MKGIEMRHPLGVAGSLVAAMAVAFASPVQAATPSFVAGSLANLPGGAAGSAAAVNDAGLIVGWATTAAGNQHAVAWNGGGITDLGTLPADSDSYAAAVSQTGLIVGASGTGLLAPLDPANETSHAVSWRDGVITDLGTLPGGTYTVATGVNDAGQVVGCGRTYIDQQWPGSIRGFIWEAGRMTILEPPWPQTADVGTLSCALGINDDGDVVGYAMWAAVGSGTQTRHAISWHDGVAVDLGVLQGTPDSTAIAINDAGRIVGLSGRYEPDLSTDAVRWTGRHVQPFARVPGERFGIAVAVNLHGTAVGQCATDAWMYGCRWRGGTVSLLLPRTGDVVSTASGINRSGLAVGYSQDGGYTFRAVTWATGD